MRGSIVTLNPHLVPHLGTGERHAGQHRGGAGVAGQGGVPAAQRAHGAGDALGQRPGRVPHLQVCPVPLPFQSRVVAIKVVFIEQQLSE